MTAATAEMRRRRRRRSTMRKSLVSLPLPLPLPLLVAAAAAVALALLLLVVTVPTTAQVETADTAVVSDGPEESSSSELHEQLQSMRVGQLRQFLNKRGVDCPGCIERRDLLAQALQSVHLPEVSETAAGGGGGGGGEGGETKEGQDAQDDLAVDSEDDSDSDELQKKKSKSQSPKPKKSKAKSKSKAKAKAKAKAKSKAKGKSKNKKSKSKSKPKANSRKTKQQKERAKQKRRQKYKKRQSKNSSDRSKPAEDTSGDPQTNDADASPSAPGDGPSASSGKSPTKTFGMTWGDQTRKICIKMASKRFQAYYSGEQKYVPPVLPAVSDAANESASEEEAGATIVHTKSSTTVETIETSDSGIVINTLHEEVEYTCSIMRNKIVDHYDSMSRALSGLMGGGVGGSTLNLGNIGGGIPNKGPNNIKRTSMKQPFKRVGLSAARKNVQEVLALLESRIQARLEARAPSTPQPDVAASEDTSDFSQSNQNAADTQDDSEVASADVEDTESDSSDVEKNADSRDGTDSVSESQSAPEAGSDAKGTNTPAEPSLGILTIEDVSSPAVKHSASWLMDTIIGNSDRMNAAQPLEEMLRKSAKDFSKGKGPKSSSKKNKKSKNKKNRKKNRSRMKKERDSKRSNDNDQTGKSHSSSGRSRGKIIEDISDLDEVLDLDSADMEEELIDLDNVGHDEL